MILPQKTDLVQSVTYDPEQTFTVTVVFQKFVSWSSNECIHFYNVLFMRVMKQLSFERLNYLYLLLEILVDAISLLLVPCVHCHFCF